MSLGWRGGANGDMSKRRKVSVKQDKSWASAVQHCARVNTALYTESFKRVALSSLGLEMRMVKGREGRECLSSLTSFQGINYFSHLFLT